MVKVKNKSQHAWKWTKACILKFNGSKYSDAAHKSSLILWKSDRTEWFSLRMNQLINFLVESEKRLVTMTKYCRINFDILVWNLLAKISMQQQML